MAQSVDMGCWSVTFREAGTQYIITPLLLHSQESGGGGKKQKTINPFLDLLRRGEERRGEKESSSARQRASKSSFNFLMMAAITPDGFTYPHILSQVFLFSVTEIEGGK